jgi:hypothetical protein
VQLYSCNGGTNQQWLVSQDLVPRVTKIQSMLGLCLDSSGGPSVGGGTQLVINECANAAASQNWTVRGAQFQLNTNAPYVCFSVDGSDTANHTPVLAYSCNEQPAQLWYVTAAGQVAGSLVELSTCTGKYTQNWALIPGSVFNVPASAVLEQDATDLCVDSSGGPRSAAESNWC